MKVTVFTKIFAYTMLLVLLICVAALFLFSREFLDFYHSEQRRRLGLSFAPIIFAISDREQSPEEILELARGFANSNQSFRFLIQAEDGGLLFSTPNTENLSEDNPGLRLRFTGISRNQEEITEKTYFFTGFNSDSGFIDYGDLAQRSFLALLLMLLIAVLGAVLFAKKVTKPLEDEIIRERAMEENQRLFFSAASHELKTPIAAARAIVEGMIAGVGDFNDHPKYLRECLNTLDSQTRLVSEILEIVKLSGEETEASLHFFDLADLGNSVLAEYRPLAEIKDLAIHGEFPHVTVRCDRALLQRVLSNVIANAVQYTQEGQTIRITSSNGQKSLRVSILNTGAHISGEAVSRLFEPFYRLDTARTRHGTQSGMGLAIVKKALDRMKLPFALENTEEGVLFWVDLAVEKR